MKWQENEKVSQTHPLVCLLWACQALCPTHLAHFPYQSLVFLDGHNQERPYQKPLKMVEEAIFKRWKKCLVLRKCGNQPVPEQQRHDA